MAKVIKLKDRQGSVVLPLTRSQLVQVSQITGLDLASGKDWTAASVQDALQALMTYATTISESNSGALADIQTIKNALQDVLSTTRAVANYVDSQDTAYLNLAYAKAESEAATALNSAKTYTGTEVATALETAKTYTGTEVAASEARSYAKAESEATTALNSAKAYTSTEIAKLDADVDVESGKVITGISETDGVVSIKGTTFLNAGDIKRTSTFDDSTHRGIAATDVEAALAELEAAIQVGGTGSVVTLNRFGADTSYTARYQIAQGGTSLGYIDIPKDMVATDGSLVYGSLSGETFTENASGDPYIQMTIANGDPFYIPVKGLVEYNEFSESDEIGFTDSNHNVTAYVREIDTDKVKHNGKSVTSYISDINTTLGEHQSDLSSYNTRISNLETAAAGLSYTVTDDSSYISVTSSTSGGATTFTISTENIASDTNLQALQTAYNNLNTELSNSGIFYEQVGNNEVSDVTLTSFS